LAISRFQSGDASAFDDLVRRHWQRANRFACRLTKDEDEAADVVADTFYRVFTALGSFRQESCFSTWLYRIELNSFLDLRKSKHHRLTIRFDELSGGRTGQHARQIADPSESAHDLVVRRQRIAAIEKAMNHMPASQREAFMMFQADAMSYEEIAKVQEIPVGTIKSRLSRARLHVRKTMYLQRIGKVELL